MTEPQEAWTTEQLAQLRDHLGLHSREDRAPDDADDVAEARRHGHLIVPLEGSNPRIVDPRAGLKAWVNEVFNNPPD